MEHPTSHEEFLPQAPPPSPTKFTLLNCAQHEEACPSPSCTLRLIDRKIEAHQARLSPTQDRHSSPYSPSLLHVNVSGRKLEPSIEPMRKMTSLRQASSVFGNHDITMTNSSYHSTRSSGNDSLVSTPKSSPFCALNLQSCGKTIGEAPGRFCIPPQDKDASGPRPTFTGRDTLFPTSVGSSTIPEMAELPLEYKQSKTDCWPGPCSQLLKPENVSMPEATMRSISHTCDFVCACCLRRVVRCNGEMPSCGGCLEAFASDQQSNSLQDLTEHARVEEEETGEEQTATLEEVHSHFSDDSTDEDDEGEKVASNVRLFKFNQKSRSRLSWGSLFSKP